MSTWQIEHTPAAGGGSATYTLAALNASSLSIQFTNWADDSAALTVRGGTAAFDAPAFAYRDKVVIWRDGARFFHGWVTGLGLAAERSESRTYTITGPSWWLEHLPFMWPTWPAKEELSLGERASFRWIGFALDSAINKGAPIAKDSGNYATFILPTPDIRASSNCLEVLQRVARLHPMSAGWWDYSGEVPVFRAALRSALPVQTVTIGTDSVETFGFTPLPDQQVESVHIAYNYTDTYGAHSVHNTAGTEPYGYGPNKLHVAIDVETYELASEAQSAGIAPLLYASLSPLAWSGAVNMHETVASLQVIRPGSALSVAGGRAEWATMATVVQSTQWVVSAATNDTCSITLGAPEHLGPQDYLEFARAGTLAASSAGNNPSPYDPPTPPAPPTDDTQPGTIDDLNEETGGSPPSGTIAIQTRGGTWSLCGYSAYDGTQPTRRWRTETPTGSVIQHQYNTNEPPEEIGTYTATAIGARSYSACVAPSEKLFSTAPTGSCSGDTTEQDGLGFSAGVSTATTATQITYTGTGGYETVSGCCGSVFGCPVRATGAATRVLSNPDTESAAIARRMAVATWTSANTAAIRTVPVTVASGIYDELRWGTYVGETYTPLTGLSPWQRYRAFGVIEMQPVDELGAATGDWYAAGETSSVWIASIDGTGGCEWQYIAPTAGYRTRITGLTVEAW